jgi:hypothetical protein
MQARANVSLPVKIIMAASAIVVAMTSFADAKSRKARKPGAAPTQLSVNPYARGANLFPPGPVMYSPNDYLGDDPDPFIRLQLMRDLGAHFGGTD